MSSIQLKVNKSMIKNRFNIRLTKPIFITLFILIGIDAILVLLHVFLYDYIPDPKLLIFTRWGYGETYQYLKGGFIAGYFIFLIIKYRQPSFWSWSAIFLFIVLDDSLELHEYYGFMVGDYLGLGKTIGEALVFGFSGIILFIPVIWILLVSKNNLIKDVFIDLIVLFSLLVLAGVGFDILHDLTINGSLLNSLFGLLEDGGEMVVMSIIVAYVIALAKIYSDLTKNRKIKHEYRSYNKTKTASSANSQLNIH